MFCKHFLLDKCSCIPRVSCHKFAFYNCRWDFVMRFCDERVDSVLESEKYMCTCNMTKSHIEDTY